MYTNEVLLTAGVVLMHMTSGPVCNKTDQITCTSEEDLNAKPEWHLTTDAGLVFDITDGTESVVTSSTGQTTVMLNYISENWAGTDNACQPLYLHFKYPYYKQDDSEYLNLEAFKVLLEEIPTICSCPKPH